MDIAGRSVWNALERTFIDIRVFHAPAPSNASKHIPAMYISHEQEKKRSYNARVLEVEKGTFTPVVFSTTGGMGNEAGKLLKKLAQRIEMTKGQRYSDAVSFMRRRLRFELLKTTCIAIRGDRGFRSRNEANNNIEDLDLSMEPRAT